MTSTTAASGSRTRSAPLICALLGALFPALVVGFPIYVRLGCSLEILHGIGGGLVVPCEQVDWSPWWMSVPFISIIGVLHVVAVTSGLARMSRTERPRGARWWSAIVALTVEALFIPYAILAASLPLQRIVP